MPLKISFKLLIIIFCLFIHTNTKIISQIGQNATNAQNGQVVFKLMGISVEGNKFADTETILAISGLITGTTITYPYDEKITSAIKAIWERKQFSKVDILVDKVIDNNLFLIIKVEERKRISEIIIENNQEIKSIDILKAINKRKGDLISEYDSYLIKKTIKSLYDKEGLAFAKVDVNLIATDTLEYMRLKIYINEGNSFYVKSIIFDGNSKFSDEELASTFDNTKTKSWYQIWRSSKFDKEKYLKDLDLLKNFFKKNGFIDANIIKDTLIYDDVTQNIDIKIDLIEGQKVFIRDIKFDGNTVFTSDVLKKRLEFNNGDAYDVEKFDQNLKGNQDQTDAASMYNNNGYLSTQLMKEEVRVSDDSVDIVIKVYENERFKIRRIDIVGNTKTKDKVIRRELFTRPGDFFDRSAIINSIKALGMMNYFNPEALQPSITPVPGDNTAVDIVYKVEERSTDTFNASIGFAGSFGLTGSVGFTFNNFSVTEPLQGGGGQIFNFNWEFGQLSRFQSFSIGLTEPWLNDEPTTLGFNVYDTKFNLPTYKLRRTGASANIGRRFKWPDDYFRGDWSFRFQYNDVGDNVANTMFRNGTEFAISQTFSRTNTNNMFFPSTGSRFILASTLAAGGLGIGTIDYFKNELTLDFYNSMLRVADSDKLVLYLGTKMGYVEGLKSDSSFNPIELYRMGGNGLGQFGVTPLRGYVDQSIGRNGGKLMSRYMAELRLAVSLNPMPIYVYAFAEAGNVWDTFSKYDPFDLKRSAGLGLQMFLNPIGIVGFSYGYGFDAPRGTTEPSGWRFLFHLGQQ
jgi:outer membrane protein insertion porin family